MLSPYFIVLGAAAFISKFVENIQAANAYEEATRRPLNLTECTQEGIFKCYSQYSSVLDNQKLFPKGDGSLDSGAYTKVCRDLSGESLCYVGFTRCPESMKHNFTRREDGFRKLRSSVCEGTLKELFAGAVMSKNCTDMPKLTACFEEEYGNMTGSELGTEERLCRETAAIRVCKRKTWIPSCPLSMENSMALVDTVLDALESLRDCESMYRQGPALNDSSDPAGNLTNLALMVTRMGLTPEGYTQAIASLSQKMDALVEANERQETANANILKLMESIDGVLHKLQKKVSRRCRFPLEAPGEKPSAEPTGT